LLIGMILYPSTATGQGGGASPGFGLFVALVFKEVLTGAVIGIIVQIFFLAATEAGSLIEFQAGLKPDEIFAPQLTGTSGPMSRLMGQLALVTCVTTGLHLHIIRGIADSYAIVPLLSFPAFGAGFLPVASLAGKITAGFFWVAFQLSAPVIVMLVLIKIGTALLFRLSFAGVQQDPVSPLTGFTAYAALLVSAGLISSEIFSQASRYMSHVTALLEAVR